MNLCCAVEELVTRIPATITGSKINNNISPRLCVDTCEESLLKVLYELLCQTATYTNTKNIRIAAKAFHNIILIQFKYKDKRQESDIENTFDEIKRLAELLGGCLYISDNKTTETTISFTFRSVRTQLPALA